jgi:para-nitrobenzyl esterase
VLTGRPIRKENIDSFYSVSAESIGINFARKHAITTTDEIALLKLRKLSVEEIVDGGQETDGQNGPRIYSGPIIDGKLVVETAESAYQNGRHMKIPLIIGNCSAEIGGPFVSNSKTKEELFTLFGEFKSEAKTALDPNNNKDFNEILTQFNTNWVWGEPARMTARVFESKKAPTYVYQFGYVPAANQPRSPYGAGHGSEVSYVFNTLNARWGSSAVPNSEEKELARVMSTYWSNFAKTGDPNGNGLPNWPLYNHQQELILDIELNGTPKSKPDPRKKILDVIEKANKLKYQIQFRGI